MIEAFLVFLALVFACMGCFCLFLGQDFMRELEWKIGVFGMFLWALGFCLLCYAAGMIYLTMLLIQRYLPCQTPT
jgi:uncharacterized protein YybS (DUF2232 family)